MNRKLQIFVSSTFEDLKEERQLIVQAILEMGHIPAGMEYFVSENESQFDVIKKWINKSDAYILIAGGRYGTINNNDDFKKSYTHMEYDYACRVMKKHVKIIKMSDAYIEAMVKNGVYKQEDVADMRLRQFRDSLPMANIVNNTSDIGTIVKTLISDFDKKINSEKDGWIRSEDVSLLLNMHNFRSNSANNKNLADKYYLYYYSTTANKHVESILNLRYTKGNIIAKLKNDINTGNATYEYDGIGYICDNYFYVEMKNKNDHERVFISIRLLPGLLRTSIGIILAQSKTGQATATTFIISDNRIDNTDLLNEFREDQKEHFFRTEELLVDEATITDLTENVAEYSNNR